MSTFSAMPTLEPDLEQIQAIAASAAERGSLTREESRWRDALYQNLNVRLQNLLDGARLIGSRIYERQEVAAYWEKQTGVFEGLLNHFENHAAILARLGISEQPASLAQAIKTLSDIIEICRDSHELHS
jgi:hypothetical protein